MYSILHYKIKTRLQFEKNVEKKKKRERERKLKYKIKKRTALSKWKFLSLKVFHKTYIHTHTQKPTLIEIEKVL